MFFHYVSRHPELVEDHVDEGFFATERTRATVEVVLYAVAGVIGYLIPPPFVLVIFLALPFFLPSPAEVSMGPAGS